MIGRRFAGLAAAATVLVLGLSACGGDAESDETPEASATRGAPVTPGSYETLSSSSKDSRWGSSVPGSYASVDGVLVKDDGTEIRNWGDPRVRQHVTGLFARMQTDFRAGEMDAVCSRVDPQTLSSFAPRGVERSAGCEQKLRAFAAELREDGIGPEALRLLWVRTYPGDPGETGIWIEDSYGERFRAAFVDRVDGRWVLQLGTMLLPEALAMRLVRR